MTTGQLALESEVSERLDQSALELSGGQQQRLCIARDFALKPQVLLTFVDAQQVQRWESRRHFFCAAAEAGFLGSLESAGRSILASMDSDHYTTDTSREAFAVQLDCLRKMTPRERIRKTCAMSRQVRKMAFEAIRRRHPEFDDRQVQLLFIELTYGKPLADQVRRWQAERPA